jgi:prepilin-type N-terminal cleavage/methylation domain-containing protein
MKVFKSNRGFTLIELLLVVGIVAIILAVIVPLGLRARIDAKYGVVRQNGSELASFSSQWVEKSIQAQDEQRSLATVKDYYASLAGQNPGAAPNNTRCNGQWIAAATPNNWNLGTNGLVADRTTINITGRLMNGVLKSPEDTVEDIIPPDKVIRNPFTEVSVFRPPNDPVQQNGTVVGALALGCAPETDQAGGNPWIYYGFAFQGTDSTLADLALERGTFHAGMSLFDLAGIRNGIFLGRFR